MDNFISKVKYRWKVAPTWIKTVDITCWVGLSLCVLYVLL